MSRFTDYEVLGRVAAGASGTVWKARDVGLDRLVALKEIPDSAAAEVRVLASLSSNHVVQIFGVVADGARCFIVEEWIDGATLREVLRSSGPLSVGQALSVVRGALLGLADVHHSGLVHGDISPSNILIDTIGSSRLIDFGSTVRIGEQARASTGAFAAPEVLAEGSATASADVFAAAAVLAMLLRGRTDLRPSTRGVEAPVRGVLDRALDTDPARRYPDAAHFLAALEEAAQRRYGRGWWTTAGLGALASASSAALLPNLAGGPFTTSGSGVVAERAHPNARANPVRSTSRRNVLIGVGGGVVVAGVVLALAFAAGDKKGDPAAQVAASRGASALPAGASSPTTPTQQTTTVNLSTRPASPTKASVARFRYRSVITRIEGGSVDHVGQVFTGTWTFASTCNAAGACVTSVGTPGGKFALAATKTMTRSGTESIRCPLINKPQALSFKQVLTIKRAPDGLPVALKGTGRQVSTGCGPSPTITYYALTVTPV